MSSNDLGLTRKDYQGAKSTLCTGCGHDSITNSLITALFQASINPYSLAKMSGIGCSSKTTNYFLDKSSGFNSIHGRMAPVATGAKVANHNLQVVGISGDGDTASIGLGGFAHLIRRNLPMVYVVENNGVYGLTKGQFSATADEGSTLKSGVVNQFQSMDLCSMAIELGASFVARSFSGDAKQLVPLLKAAFQHEGTAFIDVISPCITFANHEGSTKSYTSVKEMTAQLQELGYYTPKQEISVDYEEGAAQTVELHDGSHLQLKKIDSRCHDVTNGKKALELLYDSRQENEFLTGLFYYNKETASYTDSLKLPPNGLAALNEKELRPQESQFKELMTQFR